jgi:hypothetical protein
VNTTPPPSRQSDRIGAALGLLMLVYPRRFRLLHQQGLIGMWRESYPPNGVLRRIGYWGRVLGDSLASGVAARWEERGGRSGGRVGRWDKWE